MVAGTWMLEASNWKLAVCVAAAFLTAPVVVLAQDAPAPAAPRVSISGYVQPRYDRLAAEGETRDTAFLRRAVVAIKAELSASWNGELQLDAGPPASRGERLLVKDAVLRYTGWATQGLTITMGNQKMPFSHSSLQSASRRSHVERPFTGNADFGAPGRSIGVRADGWYANRRVHWAAALASTHVAPEARLLSIRGITEADESWNEGRLVVGRVEFHPLGEVPLSQGDLERGPLRFVINAAAYRWTNDHDVRPQGAGALNADQMSAVEISGGLRGAGLSVDAEYHRVGAQSDDRTFSDGLYLAGDADAHKASLEAGYLLWRKHLEITAALDTLDAETFDDPWQRASLGMNWYVNGHALKFSVMHRESFNTGGLRNVRSRATYLQSHFTF